MKAGLEPGIQKTGTETEKKPKKTQKKKEKERNKSEFVSRFGSERDFPPPSCSRDRTDAEGEEPAAPAAPPSRGVLQGQFLRDGEPQQDNSQGKNPQQDHSRGKGTLENPAELLQLLSQGLHLPTATRPPWERRENPGIHRDKEFRAGVGRAAQADP